MSQSEAKLFLAQLSKYRLQYDAVEAETIRVSINALQGFKA